MSSIKPNLSRAASVSAILASPVGSLSMSPVIKLVAPRRANRSAFFPPAKSANFCMLLVGPPIISLYPVAKILGVILPASI